MTDLSNPSENFIIKQRSHLYLPIAIVIGIIAVSTSSLFIRFAQQDAPSLVIAAVRLTFASLMLAPSALIRHKKELFSLTRKELILALLSGLFLAIHFATWITSLEYTSIASSVVLVSTAPLWVALLSPIFIHEPLTRKVFFGMLLALLGGCIIAISDSCTWQTGLSCPTLALMLKGRSMLGNLLALAGALAVTGYLLIGRQLRTKMSLIPYIFVVYSMAAVVLIFIMIIAGQSPFGYPIITYFWLFLLALIPQIIGHSTYNWALRYLPATFVAVTTLGEPVGSTIMAYFIIHESPGLIKLSGAFLILTGIFITSRSQK
jgi:drug/metabolite transporter (DMT)-like permease